MCGVSFVIPVRNGARWLDGVLSAIRAQVWSGPIEIIAIDDGSTDGSAAILSRHEAYGDLRVIQGKGSGAAAAINVGVRAATALLIAQVDQDVVIAPTWLASLAAELEDPNVGAAQGQYVPGSPSRRPRRSGEAGELDIWSRVMALDLALRYRQLGSTTTHVCTGNTIYRRAALLDVGLFDESLGYGYDNDMSYRLIAAGYRLAFCRKAESIHHWRLGAVGYARQQYGFGYGRLNVLMRHPRRAGGDSVSNITMMLQAPITAAALASGAVAAIASSADRATWTAAAVALALGATLTIERLLAGLRAAILFRDPAGLWFAPVHGVRNVAWVAALVVWIGRVVAGVPCQPAHSMRPRSGEIRDARSRSLQRL
jgi:hypothetical protein